jgi:hypothetical protein
VLRVGWSLSWIRHSLAVPLTIRMPSIIQVGAGAGFCQGGLTAIDGLGHACIHLRGAGCGPPGRCCIACPCKPTTACTMYFGSCGARG